MSELVPIDSPSPAVDVSGPPAAVEYRLDPQFVPFQRAVGWIVTASISVVMLIGLSIVWLTGELPGWANLLLAPTWLVVTAGIAWLSYTWPVLEYRHTSYTLSEDGIEIRSGVFWKQVTTVPRSRVQHIDVSQGPMERAYDLGRLVIYTAGTDHSRVELPGLNHGVAFTIRNHLLPKSGDDAV
jgi:hypothetical protein